MTALICCAVYTSIGEREAKQLINWRRESPPIWCLRSAPILDETREPRARGTATRQANQRANPGQRQERKDVEEQMRSGRTPAA